MLLSKVVYPAACGQERCTFLSGANAAAMELACLFRTRKAVDEIGIDALRELYINRTKRYDAEEGRKIAIWLKEQRKNLSDWDGLGHQKLIMAIAL